MFSKAITRSVLSIGILVFLGACASAPGTHLQQPATLPTLSSNPGAAPANVPAFDHIFLVVEENHALQDIIGSSNAPYINSLADQFSIALDYSGTTHPSLPNYLELTGGSTFGTTSDCNPSDCPVHARNIADSIEASGKTWKAYMESMPAPCTTTDSGQYAVRHDPFVYYDDIRNDASRCSAHVVPYTMLAEDLKQTETTPNLVWISPNLCSDMHNCDVRTGDSWLRQNLQTIFDSPAWKSQNSALFITWDEDRGNESNRVATIIVGPQTKRGFQSAINFSHASLLRTIEASWNLRSLTLNDANASAMTEFWRN